VLNCGVTTPRLPGRAGRVLLTLSQPYPTTEPARRITDVRAVVYAHGERPTPWRWLCSNAVAYARWFTHCTYAAHACTLTHIIRTRLPRLRCLLHLPPFYRVHCTCTTLPAATTPPPLRTARASRARYPLAARGDYRPYRTGREDGCGKAVGPAAALSPFPNMVTTSLAYAFLNQRGMS